VYPLILNIGLCISNSFIKCIRSFNVQYIIVLNNILSQSVSLSASCHIPAMCGSVSNETEFNTPAIHSLKIKRHINLPAITTYLPFPTLCTNRYNPHFLLHPYLCSHRCLSPPPSSPNTLISLYYMRTVKVRCGLNALSDH